MLLATWYKRALKESILGKLYADKSKVKGIDQDPAVNQKIYTQYVQAFQKGVFNMIKEDVDAYSQAVIPRKYFSGGTTTYLIPIAQDTGSKAGQVAQKNREKTDLVANRFEKPDAASSSGEKKGDFSSLMLTSRFQVLTKDVRLGSNKEEEAYTFYYDMNLNENPYKQVWFKAITYHPTTEEARDGVVPLFVISLMREIIWKEDSRSKIIGENEVVPVISIVVPFKKGELKAAMFEDSLRDVMQGFNSSSALNDLMSFETSIPRQRDFIDKVLQKVNGVADRVLLRGEKIGRMSMEWYKAYFENGRYDMVEKLDRLFTLWEKQGVMTRGDAFDILTVVEALKNDGVHGGYVFNVQYAQIRLNNIKKSLKEKGISENMIAKAVKWADAVISQERDGEVLSCFVEVMTFFLNHPEYHDPEKFKQYLHAEKTRKREYSDWYMMHQEESGLLYKRGISVKDVVNNVIVAWIGGFKGNKQDALALLENALSWRTVTVVTAGPEEVTFTIDSAEEMYTGDQDAGRTDSVEQFTKVYKHFKELFDSKKRIPSSTLQSYIVMTVLEKMNIDEIVKMSPEEFGNHLIKKAKELEINIEIMFLTQKTLKRAEYIFYNLYHKKPSEADWRLIRDIYQTPGISISQHELPYQIMIHASERFVIDKLKPSKRIAFFLHALGWKTDNLPDVNMIFNVEMMKEKGVYEKHMILHEFCESISRFAKSINEEFVMATGHANKEVIELQMVFAYIIGGRSALEDAVKAQRALNYKFENRNLNEGTKMMEEVFVRALDGSLLKEYGIGSAEEIHTGGIDMAQSNLDMQIKRDGAGVVLPVSQQNLDGIRIDGLVPEILSIQPAAGLPILQGIGVSIP